MQNIVDPVGPAGRNVLAASDDSVCLREGAECVFYEVDCRWLVDVRKHQRIKLILEGFLRLDLCLNGTDMTKQVIKASSPDLDLHLLPFVIIFRMEAFWNRSNHISLDNVGSQKAHSTAVHDREDTECSLACWCCHCYKETSLNQKCSKLNDFIGRV